MHVEALWRYPVKSLQGEPLSAAHIDADGLRGDRAWGILDEATGRVLTGRREPRLLFASAVLGDGDEPELRLPGDVTCRGLGPSTDAALTAWLGRPVRLVAAAEQPPGTAEFFADATDDASRALAWTMPAGRYVDAEPLLVLTTASLRRGAELHPAGAWDVRRFRPNVLVRADGADWLEESWVGRAVRIGEVAVVPLQPCVRCTMVGRAQPGLDRDVGVFKALSREHRATFGVWSRVATPGTVRVGDEVHAG